MHAHRNHMCALHCGVRRGQPVHRGTLPGEEDAVQAGQWVHALPCPLEDSGAMRQLQLQPGFNDSSQGHTASDESGLSLTVAAKSGTGKREGL